MTLQFYLKYSVLKNYLKNLLAYLASAVLALRVFLSWPILAVGIATIPLYKKIENAKLPPVTSKILSFAIFMLLLKISFVAAEIIVVFAAIAIFAEMTLVGNTVKKTYEKIKAYRNSRRSACEESSECFA